MLSRAALGFGIGQRGLECQGGRGVAGAARGRRRRAAADAPAEQEGPTERCAAEEQAAPGQGWPREAVLDS